MVSGNWAVDDRKEMHLRRHSKELGEMCGLSLKEKKKNTARGRIMFSSNLITIPGPRMNTKM